MPTLQDIGNAGCLDLLTVIGLVEMAKEETDPVRGAPFDPSRSPYRSSFVVDEPNEGDAEAL